MSFDNIIGNEKIKRDLSLAVQNNNILHSYMFIGQDGIGKKLFAKEFAKEILCINKEFKDCSSCIKFESNNHPDFFLLNEEGTTIKVEQIREITNKINEKPIVSEKKVYIINDSDKMTVDSANCLLKTLEEPPEYAVIILIASNENMLLSTVKSRCMKVRFENISNEELRKYLKEQKGYDNTNDSFFKLLNGSIGAALKLIESKDIFDQIYNLIDQIESLNIVDVLNKGSIIYNKEIINQILDYIIVCMYEKSKTNSRYLNCIDYVLDTMKRLNSNCNFDMTIDSLLLKIWGEINS